MFLKIISLGMICCLVTILLKRIAKEYVIFVQLCFAAVAGVIIVSRSAEFFNELTSYFTLPDNLNEVFSVICKGAFVCIVSKISSDICIESGNLLVSDLVELSGKVILLTLALPLIKDIINIAVSFVS